jgi:hypothetical protein
MSKRKKDAPTPAAMAPSPPAGIKGAPLEGNPILFQGVDKSSTAFRLLASMGWKEGEGLVRQHE